MGIQIVLFLFLFFFFSTERIFLGTNECRALKKSTKILLDLMMIDILIILESSFTTRKKKKIEK